MTTLEKQKAERLLELKKLAEEFNTLDAKIENAEEPANMRRFTKMNHIFWFANRWYETENLEPVEQPPALSASTGTLPEDANIMYTVTAALDQIGAPNLVKRRLQEIKIAPLEQRPDMIDRLMDDIGADLLYRDQKVKSRVSPETYARYHLEQEYVEREHEEIRKRMEKAPKEDRE